MNTFRSSGIGAISVLAILAASPDVHAVNPTFCNDASACAIWHDQATTGGSGIQGLADGTDGVGVAGTGKGYGTTGSCANNNCTGVAGAVVSPATGGIGVHGTAASGNGVLGQNSDTTGAAAAISAVSGGDGGLAYWGTGGIVVTGSALKPGGGGWGSYSDIRVKKQITSFTVGLAELTAVRPVRYKYNGLGGTSDDGKEYVGVVAQELEKVAPYMVSTRPGKLHKSDVANTDIDVVDPSAFTYMLINAVQQQQKVIERQEARLASLERGQHPLASSLMSGGAGFGVTLGLLPLGLIVARARKKKQRTT